MCTRFPPFVRRRTRSAHAAFLVLALASPLAAAVDGPQRTPAPPAPTPAFNAPLALDALDTLRGGDQTEEKIDIAVVIDGNVEGNSADNIISGDNSVHGGAFGNAAGINTLIQNSGSNVLIQNGMSVNVQFADPGGP